MDKNQCAVALTLVLASAGLVPSPPVAAQAPAHAAASGEAPASPCAGGPATVTQTVNGAKVGEARLARTVPRAYSFEETVDVGEDTASPVGPDAVPFRFTGTLQRLDQRSEPPPGGVRCRATSRGVTSRPGAGTPRRSC